MGWSQRQRKFWIPALAVTLGTCCGIASDGGWLELDSAHFQLFTTADEAAGTLLIHHFEQVRQVVQPALRWAGEREKPVQIVAFGSSGEMAPYTPNERASGFFLAGTDHDFIVLATPSSSTRTAAHEYGHLVLSQNGLDLPPWLNEGIAELYSNFSLAGPKVRIGEFIPGRILALRNDGWVSLDELLSADYSSRLYRSSSYSQSTYAECWLLSHMLVLDPRYAPRFRNLILALGRTTAQQAFQSVYGKSIGEIERDVKEYLAIGTANARYLDAPAQPYAGPVRVLRGAEFGARLTLADLLSHYPGRHSQAREAFYQLQRDYPLRADVELGIAELCLRDGDYMQASQHRTRAAMLLDDGPGNHR